MNKRLAAKEAELRQLRLAQIRTVTRLKKAEQLHRPPVVDTSSVRREELDLENKVYSDRLEVSEDRMARWGQGDGESSYYLDVYQLTARDSGRRCDAVPSRHEALLRQDGHGTDGGRGRLVGNF